jgi:hypothetical protein
LKTRFLQKFRSQFCDGVDGRPDTGWLKNPGRTGPGDISHRLTDPAFAGSVSPYHHAISLSLQLSAIDLWSVGRPVQDCLPGAFPLVE